MGDEPSGSDGLEPGRSVRAAAVCAEFGATVRIWHLSSPSWQAGASSAGVAAAGRSHSQSFTNPVGAVALVVFHLLSLWAVSPTPSSVSQGSVVSVAKLQRKMLI